MGSARRGVIGMSIGESKVIQILKQGSDRGKRSVVFQMPKPRHPFFLRRGKTGNGILFALDGQGISVEQ